MARAIWKGSISFGLVQIPVGIYPAEEADELHLSMLDRRNMSPIHFQRINAENGKEVPWGEVVKGYKTKGGDYVVLTKEDLERANADATQTVDIVEFVDAAEVEPIFFDRPYYLVPAKPGMKAYALLRETLRRTGKVGIAKVVIRTRQYVGAVMVRGDVLVLNLLRYHHEIRDPKTLELPSQNLHAAGVTKREVDMASQLVEGMLGHFDPEEFRDDYREDVMKMIKAKQAAGDSEEIAPAPKKRAKTGKVIDIVDLLKKSLAQKPKAPAKRPATKKATTNKRSKKRTAA